MGAAALPRRWRAGKRTVAAELSALLQYTNTVGGGVFSVGFLSDLILFLLFVAPLCVQSSSLIKRGENINRLTGDPPFFPLRKSLTRIVSIFFF